MIGPDWVLAPGILAGRVGLPQAGTAVGATGEFRNDSLLGRGPVTTITLEPSRAAQRRSCRRCPVKSNRRWGWATRDPEGQGDRAARGRSFFCAGYDFGGGFPSTGTSTRRPMANGIRQDFARLSRAELSPTQKFMSIWQPEADRPFTDTASVAAAILRSARI